MREAFIFNAADPAQNIHVGITSSAFLRLTMKKASATKARTAPRIISQNENGPVPRMIGIGPMRKIPPKLMPPSTSEPTTVTIIPRSMTAIPANSSQVEIGLVGRGPACVITESHSAHFQLYGRKQVEQALLPQVLQTYSASLTPQISQFLARRYQPPIQNMTKMARIISPAARIIRILADCLSDPKTMGIGPIIITAPPRADLFSLVEPRNIITMEASTTRNPKNTSRIPISTTPKTPASKLIAFAGCL